jgi:hypothetical protein
LSPLDPCPSCRAPLGGRAGCQAAFDALVAASWQDPARAAVHNLVVDTYCMQHPEEYGKSEKSYAQHLTGLCCGVEHAGDTKLYWGIAPTFERTPPPPKPSLLVGRGQLTVAYLAASDGSDFAARVRDWAADVWRAYTPQHHIARERIAIAAGARNR